MAHDFEIYLCTEANQNANTVSKILKTFETIAILGQQLIGLLHAPFINHRFHLESVDRAGLTDEEILKIANKDLGIEWLELV